ncbi:MAG: homocysteine S-methyltransferase family protein [Gammaproteobacteria bacterium]|nr:homocysteine S-methyltransferase family protein [Gammaproteobacteria bacterium]
MASLGDRLKNNEIVLLDGGVSTEIQRRGVALDTEVWSGIAHKTHPHTVRQVHEDYIRAGAQVITANTFSTARHVLESIGLGDEAKTINNEAVRLAQAARDNAATGEVWIAGSMSSSPGLNNPRRLAMGKRAAANYRELAEVLAEAGVDLIIAEMMLDFVNAPLVIEAALATGLPVWVGYSAMLADDGVSVMSWRLHNAANTIPPDDFGALVETIAPLGGAAAGVMHSLIEHTGPALEILQRHWSGPKLAYAETGRLEKPDWIFEDICTPKAYVAEVERWITEYGVQIVGGCCGTGPEHIRILKERLPHRLLA